MRNLLVINGTSFPEPEGSFSIKYSDMTNVNTGEDGSKTVEIIRENIANISVSYNGLQEAKADELANVLKTVNVVTFCKKGVQVTCSMKLTDITMPKKHFKHGIAVWGFSFGLEEL